MLKQSEILEARRLSQAARQGESVSASLLGEWLCRALDHIQASSPQADPMAARFGAGGHRYPELIAAGLGHLWIGPGYNDFDPRLIDAICKFLAKRDLPAEKGDAINAARNKIRQSDWGYLEQRFAEGQEQLEKAARTAQLRPEPQRRIMPFGASPAAPSNELTPQQQAAPKAQIEKLKKQMGL